MIVLIITMHVHGSYSLLLTEHLQCTTDIRQLFPGTMGLVPGGLLGTGALHWVLYMYIL